MRNKAICITLLAAMLAGCGSGSSQAPAPGALITGKTSPNSVVFLKDVTGSEVTTDADAAGNYAINISNMRKPYMLKAVYANTSAAYTVAPAAGKTDINTGSSVILKLLSGAADLAALYLTIKADVLLVIAGLIERLANVAN